MKKTTKFYLTCSLGAALGLTGSCSYNDEYWEPGESQLEVYLTDAPGNYEEVWIDVQDVRIHTGEDETDESGWESLPGVQTGMYNLVDLVNGRDTLLVDATIPSGRVNQIRLVLGDDNWIKIDGEEIPLNTPSAQQSGLKLNIHEDINEGITYRVVLDFDVARSVVKAGNSGNYNLKPVIRTILEAQGGNIEGIVLPDSVHTAVLAIMGEDTIGSTYADANGAFMFRAVEPGEYQLSFLPDTSSGFLPYDTTGIIVEQGQVTNIDTVWLQQESMLELDIEADVD